MKKQLIAAAVFCCFAALSSVSAETAAAADSTAATAGTAVTDAAAAASDSAPSSENGTSVVKSSASAGKTISFPFTQTVTLAFGRTTQTTVANYHQLSQAYYALEASPVSALGGMQFSEESLDVTLKGIWWPLRWNTGRAGCFRLGAGGLFNYECLFNYSSEYNMMAGAYFDWQSSKRLHITFENAYFLKLTTIFAVASYVPVISDNGMALSLQADYRFARGAELYGGLSSYELFSYPLFFAPTWTLGAAYNTKRGIRAAAEVNVRYTDMFTLSSYVDSFLFRMTVGYTL